MAIFVLFYWQSQGKQSWNCFGRECSNSKISKQSINQSITSIGMERRAKIAEGKPRAEDVGMICRDDSLGNIGEGSEGQFRCLSMCDAGGGEERGFAECK